MKKRKSRCHNVTDFFLRGDFFNLTGAFFFDFFVRFFGERTQRNKKENEKKCARVRSRWIGRAIRAARYRVRET
jgi:hypothetical protein